MTGYQGWSHRPSHIVRRLTHQALSLHSHVLSPNSHVTSLHSHRIVIFSSRPSHQSRHRAPPPLLPPRKRTSGRSVQCPSGVARTDCDGCGNDGDGHIAGRIAEGCVAAANGADRIHSKAWRGDAVEDGVKGEEGEKHVGRHGADTWQHQMASTARQAAAAVLLISAPFLAAMSPCPPHTRLASSALPLRAATAATTSSDRKSVV